MTADTGRQSAMNTIQIQANQNEVPIEKWTLAAYI